MKMEVISNDILLASSIQRYFDKVLEDFSILEGEIYIVDVKVLVDNRESPELLNKVKKLADNKKVVVLLGANDQETLEKNNIYFSGFMSYANVGFVNSLNIKSLSETCSELINTVKKDDRVRIQLFKLEEFESKVAKLKHGMDQKIIEGQRNIWLQNARELKFSGDDDEVIKQVCSWTPETSGEFKGIHLEGIFVDAFETLFDVNWELDVAVKKAVEKIAREKDKFIYLISDSDEFELREVLKKYSINWKLLSKYTLRGSILEIVIDNLSAEEFSKKYLIDFKTFINVKDLVK